jgi:hypothetical protein
VGMIKDIRHLSNDVSEAMDKTFVLVFQFSNGLLFFNRYI